MVEAGKVKNRIDAHVWRRFKTVERIVLKVNNKKEQWALTKVAKEIDEVARRERREEDNERNVEDAGSLASDNSQDIICKTLSVE